MIVLTETERIIHFHMLSQRAALKLEIKGFTFRGGRSVSAHIKRTYGITARRKFEVYEQFTAQINARFGTDLPTDDV